MLTQQQNNKINVQRNRCSTLQSDLTRCNAELSVLVPQEQVIQNAERERREASNFATEKRSKKDLLISSIDNLLDNLDNVVQSEDALKRQKEDLAAQKNKLDKENNELEQSIRANRRRFLDNDPQEGTPSFLGVRTSDDKVLLFFWVILIAFTNLVIFSYFTYSGAQPSRQVYIIINLFVISIAYTVLYYSTKIEYKLRPTTI